jgi:hypothetical protein
LVLLFKNEYLENADLADGLTASRPFNQQVGFVGRRQLFRKVAATRWRKHAHMCGCCWHGRLSRESETSRAWPRAAAIVRRQRRTLDGIFAFDFTLELALLLFNIVLLVGFGWIVLRALWSL